MRHTPPSFGSPFRLALSARPFGSPFRLALSARPFGSPRASLAILAFLSLMLSFFPQPAHAQWQFDHYDQSISITGGTATPPTFPATTSSSTFGLTWGTTSGSVTVSATLTPVFIWEGMGAATPLYVKLQGSTYVNYSPPGGAASDGLDDPQQVSPYTDSSLSSAGSHLVQVPGSSGVPDGTQVPLAPVTLSASVPNGGYINISLTVTGDTRAVTLSRNGARHVPEMKLPNGETCGEWVDPDGTAHGDTTFSYWSFIQAGLDSGEIPNINWQGFTANFSGSWTVWENANAGPPGYNGDPNDPAYGTDPESAERRTCLIPAVLWNWSPSESNDWELAALWAAPYGEGPNWSPAGRGDSLLYKHNPAVTEPLIYTATASPGGQDGAQATATYDLTFHDPVDGWFPNGLPYDGPTVKVPGTPPQANGVTVNITVPLQKDQLDDVTDNQIFSGALNTSSTILPLLEAVPSVPTRVGACMLALVGFTAGEWDTNPGPNNPNTVPVPTDAPAFQQDITYQEWMNSNIAVPIIGSPFYVPGCDTVQRFSDPHWADTLAQLPPDQQSVYWAGKGVDDNEASGSFQVTPYAIIHSEVSPWAGYQFDMQGMIVGSDGITPVLVYANTIKSNSYYDTARTWTWVYNMPPGY